MSDKLTRNSFPKGYTKNLEKRLLDVELSRNQLLMELNSLKQKMISIEPSSTMENASVTDNRSTKDLSGGAENAFSNGSASNPAGSNLAAEAQVGGFQDLAASPVPNQNRETITNTTATALAEESPLELQERSIQALRKKIYYSKPISTTRSGSLVLDQNLKSPFETIFTSLKSNPFKGYKSNASFSSGKNAFSSAAASTTSSHSATSSNDDLDPASLKHLSNYHMNLNRYLNLILYKLILPLFNASSNNGSSDTNKNLDHLIWLFFNDYNKLIPILDFELFYNDYLTFVNTYTIKKSTYSDNGELKKRYYEFNSKDQDTMIKLILILKFTLCQPKINRNNKSSAYLPDKSSLNHLDESVKLINVKHLIMMLKNINFSLSPNLDKLEISLLLFYYLIKFENFNLPNYTDNLHSHKEFLMDVINLNKHLVYTLNIDKPNALLMSSKFPEKQLIEIQRLKLYWNFKILIKLSEIYFNIPLLDEEIVPNSTQDDEDEVMSDISSAFFDDLHPSTVKKSSPASLETIVLVSNDVKITICLVKLLCLIPWNIMQFVNDENTEVLNKIDVDLSNWKDSVESLNNDENSVVFNKLNSYYLYFKVLVNINGTIDSSYFIDFVNLVYELTFKNSKSNGNKGDEISIEASESLCLHSFNFHLVTLISITSLQNVKDKQLCQKIYKLIQLYQILINYKDVDPLITTFVTYIKENILFAFSDANTIQDETLRLFSSVDMEKANSTSLFDKKVSHKSMRTSSSLSNQSQSQSQNSGSNQNVLNQGLMNFDLNAFNLHGDSFNLNDEASNTKRRKSNASTTSSFMSSNLSLNSRESSVVSSSRRLSVSSNDSMPSLFPSATSPFHNSNNTNTSLFQNNNNGNNINFNENSITSSAKKRIMDYAIQPMRTTMNRSRSLSAESRIRSSKISDRRLSGSNHSAGFTTSRENSIDVNNASIADDMVDDDIVSRILNSDVDSEVDSDVSMILTGKPMRSSNFKRNTSILPTIPSEGNLMKIMGAMETTAFDAISNSTSESKEADFDVNSLFSVTSAFNSGTKTSNDSSNCTNTNVKDDNALSPDSNSMKSKMCDFSKAFKKSTSGSISSAYHNTGASKPSHPLNNELKIADDDPLNPGNITNSNLQNFNSITNDKSIIDDDDLLRLKEHVMSMKTSIQ